MDYVFFFNISLRRGSTEENPPSPPPTPPRWRIMKEVRELFNMTERQREKQSLNAILAPDILFSFASRWGSYLWQRKQQQKQHWGKMIPTISPHNRLLSSLKTLTATSSPSFFLEQKQVLLAVRYIFFCFRLRDFWVVSTVCTTFTYMPFALCISVFWIVPKERGQLHACR